MYEIKTNKKILLSFFNKKSFFLYSLSALLFYSCSSSSGSEAVQQPAQSLPVVIVAAMPATTYQEFSASLEGSRGY
jgi:membrane fusion protein (multidrug efflux system)